MFWGWVLFSGLHSCIFSNSGVSSQRLAHNTVGELVQVHKICVCCLCDQKSVSNLTEQNKYEFGGHDVAFGPTFSLPPCSLPDIHAPQF